MGPVWTHQQSAGFLVTGPGLQTSRPGVSAVGEVRAGSVKRMASAVGEGSVVVSPAHHAEAAGQDDSEAMAMHPGCAWRSGHDRVASVGELTRRAPLATDLDGELARRDTSSRNRGRLKGQKW